MLSVLEAFHSYPVGGDHCGIRTAQKILQCGYYWTTIQQNAHVFANYVIDANEMQEFQRFKNSY